MGKEALSFESLHATYRSDDSPSPQAQIRWLLKQGFNPNIVDQAMILVYEELRIGKVFVNGFMLDQYLLSKAKELQQKELDDHIIKLERFYVDMRSRWNKESKGEVDEAGQPVEPKSFWKRIFGR